MSAEFIVATTVIDPFAENGKDDEQPLNQIHLRIQQRNARQKVTTVQGLPSNLNLEKIKKALMKQLCCNATIIDDELHGKILQFQGDHRKEIKEFIIQEGLAEDVKVHGH